MTRQQANRLKKEIVKSRVRRYLSENPYSPEDVETFGLTLIKREIASYRKLVRVVWDMEASSWAVISI